jgi:hypothetical protein
MAIEQTFIPRRGTSRRFALARRCHKGGGGAKAAMPPPPAPVAPAASTDAEVLDAGMAARRAAAKRYGLRKTIMAGETGSIGYGGGKPTGLTPRTVLGG